MDSEDKHYNRSDEFIPSELRDNVIRLDEPDHREREGYTVSLSQGNYQNDLQAAQNESLDSYNDGIFLTVSISTDINGERQNPDMRMLHTLLDVIGSRPCPAQSDLESTGPSQTCPRAGQKVLMITYRTGGQVPLTDHWSDSHYITAAFPTLLPMGVGEHLEERTIPVSLSALAGWALSHHSRR